MGNPENAHPKLVLDPIITRRNLHQLIFLVAWNPYQINRKQLWQSVSPQVCPTSLDMCSSEPGQSSNPAK